MAEYLIDMTSRFRQAAPAAERQPLLVSKLKETSEKILADVSETKTFIRKVPAGLRRIGNGDGYYFNPRVVAIGPYHHGEPNLRAMEEVKNAVAYHFCEGLSYSRDEVLQKIASVSDAARSCYTDEFSTVSDEEFANMMFVDGCFLLQFIALYTGNGASSTGIPSEMLRVLSKSRVDSILRDVMLLENQLPWVVLERLMEFRSAPIDEFMAKLSASFEVRRKNVATAAPGESVGGYKPPHLLGLFRFRQVGPMPLEEPDAGIDTTSMTTFGTAVELAEIGVKLTVRKASTFGQMDIRGGLLFGELSLVPVFLNDLTACWLVNMVAHEACADAAWGRVDDSGASSYLGLLALLMNRVEDVHELRVKRVVHSTFSDKHTLEFFNDLAPHLHFGRRYYRIFDRLSSYQKKRWVWIGVHKFIYNNLKGILTVISIIISLATLLKVLLSLKPHRHHDLLGL